MEAAYKIQKSLTLDLSEQQLVDCSSKNYGCNGGWPSRAMDYLKVSQSATEAAYPYTAKTQTCKTNVKGTYVLASYKNPAGCSNLLSELYIRPMSVTVDATKWSSYGSGVFSNCAKNINHAVTLVGVDSSGNWYIKNSWGVNWGQKGFIWLKSGNTCGICNYAGNSPYV